MKDNITREKLFGQLDFKRIATDPDFKEDSVREVIILPIIKELGYTQENIVRSKTLQHPFLKIGSKKRPINIVPDYALKVENNFAWVLDAKSPNLQIQKYYNGSYEARTFRIMHFNKAIIFVYWA